ncbi:MAG: hypothetical protein JOZ42_14605 [Acetobacteraceae bacterium]|nr:hypothetical protein [Acetobacteraceae bacterium]
MRTQRLAILLLTGTIAAASSIGTAQAAYYPYDHRYRHHDYYRHGYYHPHHYPPPYYHHHHDRPPPGYYR